MYPEPERKPPPRFSKLFNPDRLLDIPGKAFNLRVDPETFQSIKLLGKLHRRSTTEEMLAALDVWVQQNQEDLERAAARWPEMVKDVAKPVQS